WAGHRDVRLLDGGLAAWTAAGHGVATGDVVPEPGDVVLSAGHLPTVDLADVADGVAGVLLDVRAAERYRGETEPVDPVAGHVPGALNAPTTGNVGPDGRFLDAAALRERYAALGVAPGTPVTVYCGSGINAAHAVAALEHAGIAATLFPGSWSQWSNHPELPVATG
ncbi:MAG TPA: rhodanese-like domain-containing protein, partial [Nocardioides sp.]